MHRNGRHIGRVDIVDSVGTLTGIEAAVDDLLGLRLQAWVLRARSVHHSRCIV